METNSKKWLWYALMSFAVLVVVGLLVWWLSSPAKSLPLDDVLQEEQIAKLHQHAKAKFRAFIREVEKTGWKVQITSGYRTWDNQRALQNGKNASVGYSYHNYGMAIDINATKANQTLRMASSKEAWYASGIPKIAKELNLRWGGDFNGYYDPIHFDMGNFYKSTRELRELAIKQLGSTGAANKGYTVKIPT